MRTDVQSWNRVPRVAHARVIDLTDRSAPLPGPAPGETAIPHGNGRSYGDVCLDPGGVALRTRGLDRFIAFDRTTGRLDCEAGVLLGEILALVVPQGWILPVLPGTRLATVGGAIANDVHGKNHHGAGSFGDHVRELELVRSDGERIVCGPGLRPEWFAATVGGLGLTGLITRASLDLMPIANPFMITEAQKFASLDAFFALEAAATSAWTHTVAWIDCTAKAGRGVLFCGRHAPPQAELPAWRERRRRVPLDPPVSLVNRLSLALFNRAYYHRPRPQGPTLTHLVPYFHPLDAVGDWNRIYGRKGFLQYQCVVPPAAARDGVGEMLERVARSGTGSFLAVLKSFGARRSPGLLSFPRPGTTLAVDLPFEGTATEALLADLDGIVTQAGGALYPAKDARMSPAMFRLGFPGHEAFAGFVDPRFSSGFWRRVNGA